MAGYNTIAIKLRLDSGNFSAEIGRLSEAIAKVGHYASGMVAAAGVKSMVRGYIDAADAVTTLQNQLKLATGSAQQAAQSYAALYDIAQRSRVSFTELGGTYASIARYAGDMGVSQQRMLAVTESIANAMTVSGGSAASMQAALVQLSQGMASGVLRGEELNSVMEQTPRLAKAIADGLGVPIGKLRELGAEGKLSAEAVVAALESQSAVLQKEVAGAVMTVGQVLTQLQNASVKAIGEMDNATGASRTLAEGISGIASAVGTVGRFFEEHGDAIKTGMGAITGAAVAAGAGAVATALGAAGVAGAIGTVAAAFGALTAVMAANPVGLVLLGIGAVAGGAYMAHDAWSKSANGKAAAIKRIGDEVVDAERRMEIASKAGNQAYADNQRRIIEEKRQSIRALQTDLALLDGKGVDNRAEDERNARRAAAIKDQQKSEEELAKFRRDNSGMPASYFTSMEKAIELNAKGLLVGKEWDAYLKEAQGKTTKRAEGATASVGREAGAYQELMKTIAQKVAAVNLEVSQGRDLTESQKLSIALDARQAEGRTRLGAAHEASARAAIAQLAAAEQAQAVQEGELKLAHMLAAARQDEVRGIDAYMAAQEQAAKQSLESVTSRIASMQDEAQATAMAAKLNVSLASAVERVAVARLREKQAGFYAGSEGYLALQKEIDAREKLIGMIDGKEVVEQAKRTADQSAAEWQRGGDDIKRSLTDALMRGFERGNGFARNLRDTTVNMFKTMVLRPTIQAGVQGGMNMIGMGGPAAQMASGGGNALASLANLGSTANSVLGFVNGQGLLGGLGASIFGSTAAYATAVPGLTSMAAGSQAAMLAAQTGVFGAAGTSATAAAGAGAAGAGAGGLSGAIAAIPGWGWALGAAALLLGSGAFKSRGANHSGGVYSTATGDRNAAAGALGLTGGALGDFTTRGNVEIDKQLGATVGALSGVYQSLSKYAGDSAKQIDVVAGFAANGKHKDEDAYAYFKLMDKATGGTLASYSKRDGGLGKDVDKAYAQFTADMGKAMIDQLKSADIPSWMKSVFKDMDDDVTMDKLQAAVAAVQQLGSLFDNMTKNLAGFAGMADTTYEKLVTQLGGVQAAAGAVGTYYQEFFSEEERAANTRRDITAELAKVGLQLPKTRDEFRALVQANIALGDAGANTVGVLLGLSGAFAGVTQSAEDAVAALQSSAQAATDAAWATMQKSIAGARDAAQAELDLRQARLASAKAVTDLARDQARELRGQVDSTLARTAAQGNAYIDGALTAARGGQLPDAAGLRQAITDARAGMGTSAYSNRLDYEAAQLILANKLETIGDSGAAQVDVNQLLLDQAKAEVDRLDMLIKTGREALDAARGTTAAVTSVGSAVQAFYDKLFAETGKQAGGAGGSGGGGAVFGPGGGGVQAQAKYSQVTSAGTAGNFYVPINDESVITRLDKLAPLYHQFDGTGDLAGLAAAIQAAGGTVGDLSALSGYYASDWRKALEAAGIPAFAQGGAHAGGMRLVGENGPELEVTGPARIYNAGQTQALLAGLQGGNTAELARLLQELIAQGYAIGRRQVELMQSMETLARKQDAIGVKQREAVV